MARVTGLKVGFLVGTSAVVAVAIDLGHVHGSRFVAGVIVGVGVGIGMVFIGAMFAARRIAQSAELGLKPANPLTSQRWDYAMELCDLDGRYVYGSSFRGHVVFLSFWATWCGPCTAEMPSIERLRARVGDLAVLLFACITNEPTKTVRAFVKKHGVCLPIYRIETKVPEVFDTLPAGPAGPGKGGRELTERPIIGQAPA